MPYQYKREPLTPDEANRLASACETHQERLIVWTLLDTGLRVSELAGLTKEHIDWQNHRLMIYGTSTALYARMCSDTPLLLQPCRKASPFLHSNGS